MSLIDKNSNFSTRCQLLCRMCVSNGFIWINFCSPYTNQTDFFLGGGDPTSVDELSKISKFVDELFCQKWGFFENFRDTSTQITPKITFYCIFINKFPKNFEKSVQKFFAAPSAPKTCRNTSIFYPWSEDGTTPLEGSPPK